MSISEVKLKTGQKVSIECRKPEQGGIVVNTPIGQLPVNEFLPQVPGVTHYKDSPEDRERLLIGALFQGAQDAYMEADRAVREGITPPSVDIYHTSKVKSLIDSGRNIATIIRNQLGYNSPEIRQELGLDIPKNEEAISPVVDIPEETPFEPFKVIAMGERGSRHVLTIESFDRNVTAISLDQSGNKFPADTQKLLYKGLVKTPSGVLQVIRSGTFPLRNTPETPVQPSASSRWMFPG